MDNKQKMLNILSNRIDTLLKEQQKILTSNKSSRLKVDLSNIIVEEVQETSKKALKILEQMRTEII